MIDDPHAAERAKNHARIAAVRAANGGCPGIGDGCHRPAGAGGLCATCADKLARRPAPARNLDDLARVAAELLDPPASTAGLVARLRAAGWDAAPVVDLACDMTGAPFPGGAPEVRISVGRDDAIRTADLIHAAFATWLRPEAFDLLGPGAVEASYAPFGGGAVIAIRGVVDADFAAGMLA